MSWPEQDPYAASPYSASPYPGLPQSGPPAGAYPPGYGGYGYPVVAPPTNTMAIVALIMAFVCFPAGIVCGHIAKSQIRRTGEQGGGMATAALVIGYIFTGFLVAGCCIYAIMMAGLLGMAGAGSTYGG